MRESKPELSIFLLAYLYWASEIVNVADDWFPIELKLIDLVDEGIVVTGPSFKKDVATNGFVLEEKILSKLGG